MQNVIAFDHAVHAEAGNDRKHADVCDGIIDDAVIMRTEFPGDKDADRKGGKDPGTAGNGHPEAVGGKLADQCTVEPVITDFLDFPETHVLSLVVFIRIW